MNKTPQLSTVQFSLL